MLRGLQCIIGATVHCPLLPMRKLLALVLIVLFAIEHLIAMFTGKEVVPSWH